MIKAEKIVVNLYMLLGDTLQEADALVASNSQEEMRILWHRELGHMSKRGLKILAEHNLVLGLKSINIL